MNPNLICDDSPTRNPHGADFHNVLNAHLIRVKQILDDLKPIIQSVYHNSRTGAHVNKVTWLRKRKTAGKLQKELKDIREMLNMHLCGKTK